MDDLREQVELLESSANLAASISDVQKAIDQLTAARAKIAAGAHPITDAGELSLTITPSDPHTASSTLAKLQDPFKKSLESAQKDLKPIYSGLNKYGKVLDRVRFIDHFPLSGTYLPCCRNSKISLSRPPRMMRSRLTPRSSTAPLLCTSSAKVSLA
jgi:hypothetical protein